MSGINCLFSNKSTIWQVIMNEYVIGDEFSFNYILILSCFLTFEFVIDVYQITTLINNQNRARGARDKNVKGQSHDIFLY